MLTAWATILYMLMYHGADSSGDAENDLTTACLRLCSDKDTTNTALGVDRCAVGCQRVIRLAFDNNNRLHPSARGRQIGREDRLRSDPRSVSIGTLKRDRINRQLGLIRQEPFARPASSAAATMSNRLQTQDGEAAAADRGENVARSGRAWFFPDVPQSSETKTLTTGIGSRSRAAGTYLRIGRRGGDAVKRRRAGRMRTAGRYLRIGRADESAAPEMAASGTAVDGRTGAEQVADMLHLRKVNRRDAAPQQQP